LFSCPVGIIIIHIESVSENGARGWWTKLQQKPVQTGNWLKDYAEMHAGLDLQ